ncbi:SH3 domain-binding protein 5 [Lates japonicus]|uniref:SH3 domain-binding protein 5 n=1 Tax=Lates japonicus TaxID=270547 RepID=A0AAD3RLH5_LATJO|nr:SH3 domain-binding protein 5 [Lates japonicus]
MTQSRCAALGMPLLGPRSQCSGASSPDCDQERGDRQGRGHNRLGLSKLTLNVAHKTRDSGDEEDPITLTLKSPSPSAATAILL